MMCTVSFNFTGAEKQTYNSNKKYNRRIGIKPCLVEVEPEESIDIDTEYDMKLAQALYKYEKE